MARKGKEIALQRAVETQEDWEDMLSKEGLCVIDVFQEWCGPAVGMVGTFRKIKNELGDNLLKFITAKCDTIDALEKYRGRCEPCFLFYAGGVLVAVIRGANAPLILRTITEQLAQEHKVLEGQAERKEIKDTMIAKLEEQEKQREDEEAEEEGVAPTPKKKPEGARRLRLQEETIDYGDDLDSEPEPKKEVSVVIIKPDAVQSGKAEEIMAEMKKRGIEILRQEERLLTDEEVKNVYIHLQDEPYFEDLVTFMTSAQSIVLAITKGKTGENIIQEFRELIGPTDTEEAKEKAPESIRAKFGSDKYMNAVHGSDSNDTAARELAFFFPDFVAPNVDGAPKLQRTLALIRPDAYKNNKEQILEKIRESGFKVAMQKEITLTKPQAEDFYREHEGQDYFDELTDRMSCGPLLALGLAREDAVTGWRQMLGPTIVDEAKEQEPDSLRAQFAEEGAKINMLHGSDSEETAQKEIEYFFPMEQTLAVIKPDAYQTKDEIIEKIHESGFRIAARKETTLSKEIAEQFYADHQDKEYYNELVDHMCSGPTYFMVLSREGAVDGWRSLIGPTDPSQAKESDPDTLRGMYGQDTLRNAVHGSSNKEHAMQNIEKIFGDLSFNKDGTVKEDTEVPRNIENTQQKITVESVPESTSAPTSSVLEPDDTSTSAPKSDDTSTSVPEPETNGASTEVATEPTGVPNVVLHEVPSVDPDHLEEAIADQQQISYETATEQGGPQEKKPKPQTEPVQKPKQEDKPPSPKPEEKKEEEGNQESAEQTDVPATQEEQGQQEETQKPAEQEPVQQEQSEAQEVQQDQEAQPAPEAAPETTPEAAPESAPEAEKTETEEKPKTPEAQTQEPAQTEQTQAAPETQTEQTEAEPAPEHKEESKPEETKPEETKPEETKQEETKPEETKQEEAPKQEQTEAQAETTGEKKEESTPEQKEESKPEEQKAEGDAQQTV